MADDKIFLFETMDDFEAFEKACKVAEANALLLYQYCASWGNPAKTVDTIKKAFESAGMESEEGLYYLNQWFLKDRSKSLVGRLHEVLEQKLKQDEALLEKCRYQEDARNLSDMWDGLNKAFSDGVLELEEYLYEAIQSFVEDAYLASYDLPSKKIIQLKR